MQKVGNYSVLRFLTSLLVLAALASFAQAPQEAVAASSADPRLMVLRLKDLPVGFIRDTGYYANNARAAKESSGISLADYNRWGRTTGYAAEFSRDALFGILYLESNASSYRTAAGARDSLHRTFALATRSTIVDGQRLVFKRVSMGAGIGHEARMYFVQMTVEGDRVSFYVVVWRHGNVKSSVRAVGLAGSVDAADVVALARKQQARILAALR